MKQLDESKPDLYGSHQKSLGANNRSSLQITGFRANSCEQLLQDSKSKYSHSAASYGSTASPTAKQ